MRPVIGDVRRVCAVLLALLMVPIGVALAPVATAGDAPIGRMGETLRVEYADFAADVTLTGISPTGLPPGMDPSRGIIWRADMTVHVVKSPTPFWLSVYLTYSGVTRYADAYVSEHSDAPDALETVLQNAPPGSTVSGAVYFDVYRDPITNVIVRSAKTGVHLAQFNLY